MAFRCPPEFTLRNAARLYQSVTPSLAAGRRTYHAALCTEIGKPIKIVSQEKQPILENNQIRVAVKRAAINFSDVLLVQGMYQVKQPMPFIPGSEVVAKVLEVGADVRRFRPGDDVVGLLFQLGGFAEEVVADDKCFYQISGEKALEEGAAVVVSYGTAETALARAARIKESEYVLITAAAGALGLAAVDLAANVFKANVIAACGGSEKCRLASSFGAKATIDYTKENVRDRVKEITQGRGVDIVFDVVGGQVLEDGLRCLAFEGRLLTLGYTSGKFPKIAANILLVKNVSVHGIYWGSYGQHKPDVFQESVSTVLQWWQDGKIRPHVGKVFPLSQVNEALEYVSRRQSTGKVLLDCTQPGSI